MRRILWIALAAGVAIDVGAASRTSTLGARLQPGAEAWLVAPLSGGGLVVLYENDRDEAWFARVSAEGVVARTRRLWKIVPDPAGHPGAGSTCDGPHATAIAALRGDTVLVAISDCRRGTVLRTLDHDGRRVAEWPLRFGRAATVDAIAVGSNGESTLVVDDGIEAAIQRIDGTGRVLWETTADGMYVARIDDLRELPGGGARLVGNASIVEVDSRGRIVRTEPRENGPLAAPTPLVDGRGHVWSVETTTGGDLAISRD